MIFVDYILRILRNARFIFQLPPKSILCPWGHFLQYSEWGVRGSEHPQNWPPKNRRFFPSRFDPLRVPHKNFASYRISWGRHPLPPSESSGRISAPNPEIWGTLKLVEFGGGAQKGRKSLDDPIRFLRLETPLMTYFKCAKFRSSEIFRFGDTGGRTHFWT